MWLERTIQLRGIVEGVGMRPALFRHSVRFGLTGQVLNREDEVELVWEGSREAVEAAFAALPEAFPPGSRVDFPIAFADREIAALHFQTFAIVRIASPGAVNLLAAPDRAPCPRCRAEVRDNACRRRDYVLNSCSECGPRATVIEALPYDRDHTAWREFPLCPDCLREYRDPADRRFHVEGISCPVCGPRLQWLDRAGAAVPGVNPLAEAGKILAAGGLVALKGVGGFLLLADPRSAIALERLRKFKRRPAKPLALLAKSLAAAENAFVVEPACRELLASAAAPMILLRWREMEDQGCCRKLITPDAPDEAAVMLGSSLLHELIFDFFPGELLVATSGNLADEPPALDTAAAIRYLGGHVDGFVTHERRIRWRHDDSLVAFQGETAQLWRRARGYGWEIPGFELPGNVLALGAGLKNTFAIAGGGKILLSPHHGELEEAVTFDQWRDALRRTLKQWYAPIDRIAVDCHRDYPSSRFGAELAAELGVELLEVPHHYSHALSLLAETRVPAALALVFDGVGLGPDGTLWGGELLRVGMDGRGERLAHFAGVPLPGGDLAVLEPYRQLAGRRFAAGASARDAAEELLHLQCRQRLNAPLTSAAGRLFDAFAALIGVSPRRVSYEGQAAVRLEALARSRPVAALDYPVDFRCEGRMLAVDWRQLFADGFEPGAAAAYDFHRAVAAAARQMVLHGLRLYPGLPVLLTGGVFQNRLLTRMLRMELERLRIVSLIHSTIPPNDGGISVGQTLFSGLNFRIDSVD